MFSNTLFWDKLAIKCYRKLMKENPNNPLIFNNLALAYLRVSKSKQAIKYFRKAISIDKEYLDPYYHLGKLFQQLEQKKQALYYLKKYEHLHSQAKGQPQIVADLVSKLLVETL
ncbi:MAG: tetratricopeptide repeat protein [Chlamydiales bacterium]|nr:tetratricopeptide repeat protein [Chlamydiales bacterium]NCF71000.1 tetratricopeptide repeat protein [Chlamydiales bacterium]